MGVGELDDGNDNDVQTLGNIFNHYNVHDDDNL